MFLTQPLLIVVPSVFCLVVFFGSFFPSLQAQESLASLEREIGKVVGDANVIENSDVCTESVSVSFEPMCGGNANFMPSMNFGK